MSPPGQAVGGWKCDIRGPKCSLGSLTSAPEPPIRAEPTGPAVSAERLFRAYCFWTIPAQAHVCMFTYEPLPVGFPKILEFHFLLQEILN